MAYEVTVTARFGKYPVIIGSGLDYGKLALSVKERCTAVIVSDDNVFPLYGDSVLRSFRESGFETREYVIKNGEGSKTLTTVAGLLDFLAEEKITRSDMLIALGGGVVGDLTGFAAAIYLRGIAFLQLPTTVLSAVDSSVGGKTGVDLDAGKNLAGAFHQPIGVFCDTGAFDTLSQAVYADGMAEVIKHGMIADRDMLLNLDSLSIAEICRCNVMIKAGIVEQDEFDAGIRALLNFGHTIGHAAESLSGYRISHGHAVAIGMTAITRASVRRGLAENECLEELIKALNKFGLPTRCEYSAAELAKAALLDKKRSGDMVALVIPKSLGLAELRRIPATGLEEFIAKGLDD